MAATRRAKKQPSTSGSKRAAGKSAKGAAKAKGTPKAKVAPKWSGEVMRTSNAMDLKSGVFKLRSPAAIARSLKASAEASGRRKSTPFRSAMSMLTFEINRAGKNLSTGRREILNKAKAELRKLFNRPA